LTPHDKVYQQNCKTLSSFTKDLIAKKTEQIKEGNVGVDLLSTIINEGGDVYNLAKNPE